MRRSGDVVSKTQLLDEVWGPTSRAIRTSSRCTSATCARRSTRRSATQTILTVRGAGYRIGRRCRDGRCRGGPSGPVRLRVTIAAALVFGIAFGLASVVLVRTVDDAALDDRAQSDGKLARRRRRVAADPRGRGPDRTSSRRDPVHRVLLDRG